MEGVRLLQVPPKIDSLARGPSSLELPSRMRISFSYNSSWRHVTERYLTDTFSPDCATHFDLDAFEPNVSILKLLEIAGSRNEPPSVFAHLVHSPALPGDLHNSPVPTMALDIDSFGWTSSRIRWSMLFDYVFVWHLSLAPLYEAAGHPRVFVLPHAVDADLFRLESADSNRVWDVGWVGAFNYAHYDIRLRIIQRLANTFRMNDFQRRYSKRETAEIYRTSRIVVNVSRSDFPQEANMRCYEAMAAGALLITGVPTELTEWGFREGEHFIGWRKEEEIPDLVGHYLRHTALTRQIAKAGRDLTLREFTYQECRDKMVAILQKDRGQFFAPARSWPHKDIHLIYLEYYYRYQLLDPVLKELSSLRKGGWKAYCEGLPMALKTVRHALKRRLF